jgi:hypothetical protein
MIYNNNLVSPIQVQPRSEQIKLKKLAGWLAKKEVMKLN